MDRRDVRDLLERVAAGGVDGEVATRVIAAEPIVDLGYAKPDLQRGVRQGVARDLGTETLGSAFTGLLRRPRLAS